MEVGSGQKNVQARARGWLEGAESGFDVLLLGACQGGDGGAVNVAGNGANGGEVALGGDGEAGLDDVDAQLGELACHAEFFGDVHGEAGRLFAVAQCGVEEADEVHAVHPQVWGQ